MTHTEIEKIKLEIKKIQSNIDEIPIIDIRGNAGGSDSYSEDWITTYTGEKINSDGKGFYPDIWLNPNESLDRVLKFIERYDIEVFKKKS